MGGAYRFLCFEKVVSEGTKKTFLLFDIFQKFKKHCIPYEVLHLLIYSFPGIIHMPGEASRSEVKIDDFSPPFFAQNRFS